MVDVERSLDAELSRDTEESLVVDAVAVALDSPSVVLTSVPEVDNEVKVGSSMEVEKTVELVVLEASLAVLLALTKLARVPDALVALLTLLKLLDTMPDVLLEADDVLVLELGGSWENRSSLLPAPQYCRVLFLQSVPQSDVAVNTDPAARVWPQ